MQMSQTRTIKQRHLLIFRRFFLVPQHVMEEGEQAVECAVGGNDLWWVGCGGVV